MPIIGLTAMAEEHASKLAHIAGMDDCLSKPFTRAQLASAIRRWTSDPTQAHASGGSA
jgi:CheY-like chemotaxis protein